MSVSEAHLLQYHSPSTYINHSTRRLHGGSFPSRLRSLGLLPAILMSWKSEHHTLHLRRRTRTMNRRSRKKRSSRHSALCSDVGHSVQRSGQGHGPAVISRDGGLEISLRQRSDCHTYWKNHPRRNKTSSGGWAMSNRKTWISRRDYL